METKLPYTQNVLTIKMLIECLSLIFVGCAMAFPKNVPIGGIFDSDGAIEHAFQLSVKAVNKGSRENAEFLNVNLRPTVSYIEADVFEVSSKVCDLVSSGVAGIFGPQERVASEHVQSICDTVEIPHIAARWDPFQARGKVINLYPHAETLSLIYHRIIVDYDWQAFTILYENTDSLIGLNCLIALTDTLNIDIFLFRLGNGPDYRDVMQNAKDTEIENIVIDCSSKVLAEVLKQAQQVGLLSDKQSVLVTSLDLQATDLEPYRYSGVNFTGVRIINPNDPVALEIYKKHKNEWGMSGPQNIHIEPALMYDAVQLFARAFKQLKDAIKGDIKQLSCNNTHNWEHGISLFNFLRMTEMRGLTGPIKFDTAGFRSNFQLEVVQLHREGLEKVGVWDATSGLEWIRESSKPKPDAELSLQNKTFLVLIALTKPYGMVKESATMLSGNDQYEGFAIDIIQELSKMLGFNYTFEVQTDSVYGSYNNKTGKWTGMLGKIIADRADLAITDLTITSERESAVDFTMPFMNLGISILYKKPTKAPPSLFSFLSPFSSDVWLCLIGAYLFVSVLFFVIGRLSPAEWNNPYPCIAEPEVLENQFTVKNSFWFTIGSIMQQGSEIAPIGFSTRMMAACWWFFCLIMVSSYTANLAACLAIAANIPAFSNVEELARHKTIKYGAKTGGSTIEFFKNYANSKEANHDTYQKMYKYMMTTENVLTPDNDVGLRKVLEEEYAFFMESSSIEYIVQRVCSVWQVGGLLDQKGYGIAMKKNSPYRHPLNTAILKLQESGQITQLKKKWWSEKRGGGKCDVEESSSAEELGLNNVGGVFLVLCVGVALSTLFTAFELLWEVVAASIKNHVSFKQELVEELKFIAHCTNSAKPVRRRKDSSERSRGDSTGDCTPPYGFVPTVITTSIDDK